MKPLRQQLNQFFSQYRVSITGQQGFLHDFRRLANESFNIRLPKSIEQYAEAERQLVLSIRRQLKQDQLILRRSGEQINQFYLMNLQQFEIQSQHYFNRLQSYERMENIQIDEICKSIETTLLQLRREGRIQEHHLSKMSVKRANVTLPYLYFLPIGNQNELLSFISSCRYSPIKPLASYLDDLLKPLYENHTQTNNVVNGMDFIGKLAHFDEYIMLPQTIFATLKIIDIYSKVSHDRIEEALGRFLSNALIGNRLDNLTIETIQQLVRLVLRNNIFTYSDHLYQHVKGSPLSLPLTRTLVNIYLQDWQNTLVNHLNSHNELYVRYHDTAFIACQQSMDQIQILLEELNRKDIEIRIEFNIGTSVDFLGVFIENQTGRLYTRIHHDSNLSKFTLPYVMGHPRLLYRQWYQFMLSRAVRYCTTLEDFIQERIHIEVTLLTNDFSLEFIELGMNTFLKKYFALNLHDGLDERIYATLRQRLFNSINLEKQHRQQQEQSRMNNEIVHLQYLYDWGPRCRFNHNFRILWLTRIINDPGLKNRIIKLKLNTIHCYPLNALFQ